MRRRDTAITQKGQVTIPVEIRRALGLQSRDRVSFEVDPENGVAILRRAPSAVQALFGAVPAPQEPYDDRAQRESLEQLVADEVMDETA